VYNTAVGNKPMNFGIDFASGTNIQVNSNIALSEATLTQDFEALGVTDFQIQLSGTKMANITTTQALSREKLNLIGTTMKAKYGLEINESVVTPLIGNELVKNAILASLVAWILMLLFISLRFEWDYGIATIIALFHDVFIVLSVFAIFRMDVSTELIAVVLAIIGYSVDDTIVIFDRIRETLNTQNKSHYTKDDYKSVVNDALQAVTLRSLWNTFTTLIPMIFLLLLGSSAIFTFNIAMFIGLLAGAYSSIFIAAQVWLRIRYRRKPKIMVKHKSRKKEDIDELTVIGIND
jgi:SecD/SecF fusion protein